MLAGLEDGTGLWFNSEARRFNLSSAKEEGGRRGESQRRKIQKREGREEPENGKVQGFGREGSSPGTCGLFFATGGGPGGTLLFAIPETV